MKATVQITATPTEGCFCERHFPMPSKPFSTAPRFNFQRAAREYAKANGMVSFEPGRKGDKVAFAIIPSPCNHRPEQRVRLDWRLAR